MTNEEALKILDARGRLSEAECVAVQALKKRIPELVRETISPDAISGAMTGQCPDCLRVLTCRLKTQAEHSYCPRCGKALDWGHSAKRGE